METQTLAPYLENIISAEPIKVIQVIKLLSQEREVHIKPSSHRTYYCGNAVFVPKEFYEKIITDISIYDYSIAIFVEPINEWDIKSDIKELEKINKHYRNPINKL